SVSKGGASAAATFTLTATATAVELWRLANFGTSENTGPAADSADPDGDGMNNLSEYAAGTDPNNAADVFKVLSAVKGATSYTVTVPGKASRSYVLERSASLGTGPWTAVGSVGPLAVPGTITLSDPAAPTEAGFYRVRVSAP
ncbi:MAG: thrombospondin type 3 repeat-containing protein, partial [Verrucomicrobia bacterium]|nr:thrombospondin type 3 repeat-containing protein [Verrucomicrobiota bacterium]